MFNSGKVRELRHEVEALKHEIAAMTAVRMDLSDQKRRLENIIEAIIRLNGEVEGIFISVNDLGLRLGEVEKQVATKVEPERKDAAYTRFMSGRLIIQGRDAYDLNRRAVQVSEIGNSPLKGRLDRLQKENWRLRRQLEDRIYD